MAKPFLVSIDLNKNEILNGRFQNLATAPSSPAIGQFYGNTSDGNPYYWNGTAWKDLSGSIVAQLTGDVTTDGTSNVTTIGANKVLNSHLAGSISLSKLATDPLARANHTGTQTASTISDFDTQVRASRLDQMAAPTSALNLNSQRITSLATPTADNDAVTKAYVDATKTGLDFKDSVRVATTANITLSGTQTIDAIAVVAGDRVLVKDQATGSQNGIYVVAAGAWARSDDTSTSAEVTPGMYCYVEAGTANGTSSFVLSTPSPITLGTTSLTFTKFSGAGQLTAGTGITISGNQVGLNPSYDIPLGQGGTGASDATTARANLGLAIGTNVQAFHARLTDVAACGVLADTFLGGNAANLVMRTAAQVKTSLALNLVENTTLSTWAGTASITTLGTITTGVWNGTAIAVGKGGTGLTAAVQGGVPYGSSTSAITFCAAGAAGKPLLSGGTGAPSFGTLTVGGGGTGLTAAVQGGLLYGVSASTTAFMAAGTAGQILKSAGTSAPTWSSYKYAADIGNGALTDIVVNHALNSQDVQVTVYRKASPYDEVMCDIEHTDTNNVTLRFAVAPTAAQYRVVVLG